MNRRTYSILAGIVGTAFGAWWWRRQRSSQSSHQLSERGTTIFHNTPTASPLSESGAL